jgi:type I restriction enzyme S subunit
MLPEGWKRVPLGEVAGVDQQSLGSGTPGDFAFRYIALSDVSNGVIQPRLKRYSFDEAPSRARRLLKKGDVLFSSVRPHLLGHAHISDEHRDCVASTGFSVLSAKPTVDSRYLFNYLFSRDIERQINALVVGSSFPAIGSSDIAELKINFPDLKTQIFIADVLSTWDDAIATTEKLLANSRRQKQAVSQALLSGQRRLMHAPWVKRSLSDLIIESRLPGSTGSVARKITVKLYGKGVFAKEERRAGSDSTQYYRRKAGQFIYSKLDFLNGAFGLIPPELEGFESTLDLPTFDFRPDVDCRWFLYYVSREEFYQGHLGLANGGRKARRVNPLDLLRVLIDAPSIAEQKAIADAIDVAVADEGTWEKTLEALKNEKRALMQQLLTGKRRVRLG